MNSKRGTDHLAGERFGDFQIEALVARRPNSHLYVAHHRRDEYPAFLLVMVPTATEDPGLSDRFLRRMETVANLQHPNIASVHEIGVTPNNHAFAALEFSQSVSLAEKLKAWSEEGKRPTVIEALRLVGHIADALEDAHPAGIIHYDLRPENIRIREFSTARSDNIYIQDDNTPHFIDLGIPVEAFQPAETEDSNVLDYASPEQQEGKPLSGQSNIYSLGILLYELLAGHRPNLPISKWDVFDREPGNLPREIPLQEVRDDLSSSTYRLVQNCLWRQEWNRFETIDDMISAINEALAAEQEEQTSMVAMPVIQRRWLVAVVPIGLLLLIIAIVLLLGS